MTPENFCYWLQGYMELTHAKNLNASQFQIIQDHLNLVFNKVTPDRDIIKDLIWPDVHNPVYSPPKEVSYCKCGGGEIGYPKCSCKTNDYIPSACSECLLPIDMNYDRFFKPLIGLPNYKHIPAEPKDGFCQCKTEDGYQKLFTAHTGVSSAFLC
jgi:hypothetical protein